MLHSGHNHSNAVPVRFTGHDSPALRHVATNRFLACEDPLTLQPPPILSGWSGFRKRPDGLLECRSPWTLGRWRRLYVRMPGRKLAWTVGFDAEQSLPVTLQDGHLRFGSASCVVGIEAGGRDPDVYVRGHAVGGKRAATCVTAASDFALTYLRDVPTLNSIASSSNTHADSSFLASVVSSSGTMLSVRGVPILRTYGARMDTFVVAERSEQSLAALVEHGCEVVLSGSSTAVDRWACASIGRDSAGKARPYSTQRSVAVLVRGCDGTERSGCCRIMAFLDAVDMSGYDWVSFNDDDVYVPPCLASFLPSSASPLYAPAKHVGVGGGWRWSLCGDRGRPHTEIALPAGYGIANKGFVRLLHRDSRQTARQCASAGYFIDVAISFASWRAAVALTPLLDWTDPRVTWAGGQRPLWTNTSLIYHKVRSPYDFYLLDARTSCAAPARAAALAKERVQQPGYARTAHAKGGSHSSASPFLCDGPEQSTAQGGRSVQSVRRSHVTRVRKPRRRRAGDPMS